MSVEAPVKPVKAKGSRPKISYDLEWAGTKMRVNSVSQAFGVIRLICRADPRTKFTLVQVL